MNDRAKTAHPVRAWATEKRRARSAVPLLLLAAACGESQDETQIEAMATFASIADYEAYIEGGRVDTPGKFTTLRERLGSEDGESALPEGVVDILNADAMVRIGDHVIQVLLDSGAVAVADASNRDAVRALGAGQYERHGIRLYRVTDDVLDYLADGLPGTLSASDLDELRDDPSESGISRVIGQSTQAQTSASCVEAWAQLGENDWDKAVVYDVRQCTESNYCYIADLKHVYQRTGIYYSLQTKIKYRGIENCDGDNYEGGVAVATSLALSTEFEYVKRVRFGSDDHVTGSLSQAIDDNHELNIRSYEGTRSLRSYTLCSTGTYKDEYACSSCAGTGWASISPPCISKQ